MKEYRAPSYPKEKERRSNQDRRKDNISNALQPLALAFMKYLETSTETQERKVDAELRTAEAMSKIVDNLSNIKVQISTHQSKPKRNRRSQTILHNKVRQIILKM